MVESNKWEHKKSFESNDQLGFEGDPEIRKHFQLGAAENLLWSSKLSKFNKYNWVQERNLVITQFNIYNFRKKDVKRVISIKSLQGITKSVHKTSKEFVLHVKKEHDYRLRSDQSKQNLPIYGIKNKDLREFTTTEKDRDRGISRMPLQLARLYEEDILEEESKKSKSKAESGGLENLMSYEENMEHRMQAYSLSKRGELDKDDKDLLDRRERSETLYSRTTSEVVSFDDFQIKQIIGKGTFGKVYLVENTTNGKRYAMKSIRKDIVIEHDSIENLHLEKLILLQVNHPFIISMQYVFQKSFRVYFVMDFISGGELFKHLSEAKRFDEKRTKFYAAQVAVALGYLHDSKIIYRDLKPENILLNDDGYILLADFGLAKLNEEGDEPNSFCGTPEYLCINYHSVFNILYIAPEMILGSGHDHTLDWWALGILIYEMMIGIPPFYNKNKHQMYYLVQHAPVRWPDKAKHGIEISEDAKDLVNSLLQKDKKLRLGFKNDSKDVLAHPFFKDLDIDLLIKKQLPAPYIPKVLQTDNFASLKIAESLVPEQSKQKIESKKQDFEKFGFEAHDMKVKIRLMQQGVKNHPFWWIVIQPANKNPRGRYIEKLGFWLPRQTKTVDRQLVINKHRVRYWLGVGAQPTFRVHKILESFDFLPKHPVPLGSNSLYEKPEKEYKMQYFKKMGPNTNNEQLFYKQQLQEQMNILERKKRLQMEAMANFGEDGNAIPQIEEIKTTDIESEEGDIFQRKKNFEQLLQRFEKHKMESVNLRGNDLRYNIYMKKLNKLTRMDLGLDLEAYKDYINNLKRFAHLNHDFEIYARDQLDNEDPSFRQLIHIEGEKQGMSKKDFDETARFELSSQTIHSSLRKLKRNNRGFLSKKDDTILQEFVDSMRTYLNHFELYATTKSLFEKRKRDIKEKENREKLDFTKVTDKMLQKSNLSKKDFEHIKDLFKFDEELFLKKDNISTKSPHILIVDVGKYENEIPKDVKEILYRPQKLKKLVDQYWVLADVCEGFKREQNDFDNEKVYKARYPAKEQKEIDWIDKIIAKLQTLIDEDYQEYQEEIKDMQHDPSTSEKLTTIESSGDLTMYYKGDFQEKVNAFNNLTEEEKTALPVKDEIDKMDINELIKEAGDMQKEEDLPEWFIERHRINIAKAFMGKDGGYSLRKYKKILLKEIRYRKQEAKEEQERWEAKRASYETQEKGETTEVEAETAAPEISEETLKSSSAIDEDSDLSDQEEDWVNMDDESFQRIVEEVRAMDSFKNEEEAKAYFDEKIKIEWTKMKRVKPSRAHDLRELRDPYYKILKEERPIESRYSNYYEIDDEDYQNFYDKVDQNIGRYPIGFRQYENFENYKIMNSDSTIQEYQEDMNRQCEFHEFQAIMKRAFLDMASNPFYKFKNKIPYGSDYDPQRTVLPEDYVESGTFSEQIKTEYQTKVQCYLMDGRWYKLVDALEDVTSYWTYGRDLVSMPVYNTYMPTKEHLVAKPDLNAGHDDETGYRYNLNRMSAAQYLNPLKNYKAPPAPGISTRPDMFRPKFDKRFRRLSRPKNFGFCTINRPFGNPIWHQTQVNSNVLNMFSASYTFQGPVPK